MEIDELYNKHLLTPSLVQKSSRLHARVSIEFTIKKLEEISESIDGFMNKEVMDAHIQELKQYLNI